MTAGRDIVVHPSAPMPKGYTFVSKGNVYITAHCRSATYAANKPLYVVCKKAGTQDTAASSAVLGLRCPIHVAQAVREDERASRSARHEATARRDEALATAFQDAVLAAYPDAPRDMVPQIVRHAMTKKQGRVARTSTLALDQRVRLAVRAHIRHQHTNYDALLRGDSNPSKRGSQKGSHKQSKKRGQPHGIPREAARALTLGQVDAMEREWTGKGPQQKTASKNGDGRNGDSRNSDSENGDGETDKREFGTEKDATEAPTRPTRLCKTRAARRIAKCLESPRGRMASDAIVVDSSDDMDDSSADIMIIDSDSDGL